MTTPEQRWNGPIQDAIKRHDQQQGHFPAPVVGQPVYPVQWWRRIPGGGTARVDGGVWQKCGSCGNEHWSNFPCPNLPWPNASGGVV